MTATAPDLWWYSVAGPGFSWGPQTQPTIDGGGPSPIAGGSHTNSPRFTFNIMSAGSVEFQVTGTLTENSSTISSLSSVALLAPGLAITSPGYLPGFRASRDDQNASIIATVGASSLTFVNGPCNEAGAWPSTVGALASGSSVPLTIYDSAPEGSLAAIVSPGSGYVLLDQNADSFGGNVSQLGNGSSICSLLGAGSGNFEVTFTAAGAYTVDATFSTSDPNFQSLTLAPSITIVIS